jgi:hypothetical protein
MDIVGFLRDPESWRDMRGNAKQLAQSASNAIAGNLTGPVDLINLGLGAIGLPVSQRPVGGSEWARRAGLTPDVPQGAPRVAGETLGLLGPVVAAKYAPQIAEGLLAAGDAMPRMSKGGRYFVNQDGKIVWHGSPHKFDKFDSSKIGTGEGVQAYGQGLYTAEARDVGEQYARELSGKISVNGQPIYQANKAVGSTGNKDLDDYLTAFLGNKKAAKHQLLQDIRDVRSANPEGAKDMQRTLAELRKAQVQAETGGYLYKVDLADDAIPKMLDWDKPLYKQPPAIRRAVRSVVDDNTSPGTYAQWVREARPDFRMLQNDMLENMDNAAIAEQLRQRGVQGIRYLDGRSRAAGEGSYNYVVFPGNESLLKILERNGVPVGGLLD